MSADLEFRVLPIIKIIPPRNSDFDGESEEDDCRTPKSPRHMIPAALVCPPAPRKPARRRSCKRRLCGLEFFEAAAREEVEAFFRMAEENIGGGGGSKRRCVM